MAFFDSDSKFVSFSPLASRGFEEDFAAIPHPWSPLNSQFGPVEDWSTTSPALSHQSTPSLDSSHYASPVVNQHDFAAPSDYFTQDASSSSAPFPCDPQDYYKNTPVGGAFPNIFGSGKSDTFCPQTSSPSVHEPSPVLYDPAAADFELKLFDFPEPEAAAPEAAEDDVVISCALPEEVLPQQHQQQQQAAPLLIASPVAVGVVAASPADASSEPSEPAPKKKKIGRPKGSKNGDRIYRIAAALGRPPREIDEHGHYKQPYMDWLVARHREKRRQRREEREAWIKAGRPTIKRLDYPVRQKQAAKRARIGGRFASKKDMAVLGLQPGDKVAAVEALVQVNTLPAWM